VPLDWQGQYDDPNIDKEFKADVQAALGPDAGHWRVERPAFRSIAEQDALYAKGRTEPGEVVTQAKGGQSPHNHGLAVDVCLCKPDYGLTSKETWNYAEPDWARLWDLVDKSARLHSGHHFPHPDDDHIEAVKWRTLRQQLVTEGKWDHQGGAT
jgi:hypothetical protein